MQYYVYRRIGRRKEQKLLPWDPPATIHDFGGFPNALYEISYPAPGSLHWAQEIQKELGQSTVSLDFEWGLDHGTWSVLMHLYPEASIPVLQLSLDYGKSPEYHYQLGKQLQQLRSKGVLIVGSGNMVHNLRRMNWHNPQSGYDWAEEANTSLKDLLKWMLQINFYNITTLDKPYNWQYLLQSTTYLCFIY